jgi:hypothetical protein
MWEVVSLAGLFQAMDEKLPFAIQPWPCQKREKSPVLEDALL